MRAVVLPTVHSVSAMPWGQTCTMYVQLSMASTPLRERGEGEGAGKRKEGKRRVEEIKDGGGGGRGRGSRGTNVNLKANLWHTILTKKVAKMLRCSPL